MAQRGNDPKRPRRPRNASKVPTTLLGHWHYGTHRFRGVRWNRPKRVLFEVCVLPSQGPFWGFKVNLGKFGLGWNRLFFFESVFEKIRCASRILEASLGACFCWGRSWYVFIVVSHEKLAYCLGGKSILKGENQFWRGDIKLDDKRNMDEYNDFVWCALGKGALFRWWRLYPWSFPWRYVSVVSFPLEFFF